MTNFKHLTENELSAYASGSLEKGESQKLGRHLLNCAECRKLLPLPSAERLWAAIMTDAETTDAPQKVYSENFRSSLPATLSATLPSLLKLRSGLLWGGAALIIVFCFSFFLFPDSADTGREVVQNFDNESGAELDFPSPVQTPDKEKVISLKTPNPGVTAPIPKNLKADYPKPKMSQKDLSQNFKKPNSKRVNENISATRSVSSKCSENKTIEVEFSTNKENLVFNWQAVPKATKYHLFISDDEEILIDEFETESETTFVLKKTLDPLKTYKWKILVTLENGNTAVGESIKFTVKDFQINQKRRKKKGNSEIRCSAID